MAKVLLVENGDGVFGALSEHLSQAGFEILGADCVVSALEQAVTQCPDLILTSDSLPVLDVLDLLALKQESSKVSQIPVVVVSPSTHKKTECYKLGCDEFVKLPIDEPELLFRICAILRRTPRQGLHGTFEAVSLVDLVQLLVSGSRSGKCSVETSTANGLLYFKDGQVVHALAGDKDGEEAFLTLLKATQKGGIFVFIPGEIEEVKSSIKKRTDHLLLGLANLIDEEAVQ